MNPKDYLGPTVPKPPELPIPPPSSGSLDKYGFRLCVCGCGLPLADTNHPNWPKGWVNTEGPDTVPTGFSNGLHGPPGKADE